MTLVPKPAAIEILITGNLHDRALEELRRHANYRVHYRPDLPRAEVLAAIRDMHVLITRSETDVDRALIDAGPKLKVIARAAVGVSNIDIAYATERGILVVNTPGKNTNSAAEMTLCLLLAMMRHLPEAHAKMKSGGWDRHRFTGHELRGKRLGIVGLGNVGHRVARFGIGFDMEVAAYDPYLSPEVFERHQVRQVMTLEDLVSTCDVLTVHVPLNRETRGMITESLLARMPKGSYLVNCARGGVIDESVILSALQSGQLAAAGIDTWEGEPEPARALVEHPRVYCSPHIGASTYEAQAAIAEAVVDQVHKAIEGLPVDYPVNLPHLAVIDHPLLKMYSVLAERLGSLAGQIIEFNPSRVQIFFRGDLATLDHSLVRLSWMKGFAHHVVDDYVSFVNVQSIFDRLGVEVVETEDPGFQSYRSAIKVVMTGRGGSQLTLGGFVFEDRMLRWSLVNEFTFEIDPTGPMLLVENHDRPGVIGDVGHFLGAKAINIDSFVLSRNRRGGTALAVIKTDSEPSSEDVEAMTQLPNVIRVHAVTI